ncbi:hypothetical protein P8452_52136 [Trifolium repens]|nr:hypothetical protein P8452_52136 [Trifolium repens]
MHAARKRRIRWRHGGWLAVDVMLSPTQMEWKPESVKKRNKDTYEPLIVFEILTIEKKPSILPLQTHVTVLENLGSSSDISLVVFSWQTIVVVAASVVVYSMFFSV